MKRHHSRKKNSTKIFAFAAIIAAALFGASLYFFHGNDEVAATVNNQKIYKSEIENKLRSVFESQNFGQGSEMKAPELATMPKEVIEILAKEIYLERELTKEAQKSKAAKSAELKARIADAKNRMVRQAYINSLLEEKVGDQQIRDKYAELSNDLTGKKEYQISHIVTKTKEEAEKIAKEINSKKAKFADMAKKYSIDQDSAGNGGNLGYILEDNMFKEISEVLVTLKKDQVSQPVQTKFGWHLLKISDTRPATPLPFEAVKDNIRDQLTQDAINEINSKITKDAKIKILMKLQEAPTPPAAEEKPVEEKANTIAAPESTEAAAATEEKVTEEKVAEEKVEEKTAEKAEKKSEKSEKNASKAKKQKDKKSNK